MKKLLIIPVFFIVTSLCGQEAFVVPVLECAHKHQFMVGQTNAMIIAIINNAKVSGKTVEEAGAITGELFATSWNKDAGFPGLVKGILHNEVCFTPGGAVEILEQSAGLVKIKVTGIFPLLKKNGTFLNVTYAEYVKFCEIMFSKICEHMGTDSSIEDSPEAWIITIKKK